MSNYSIAHEKALVAAVGSLDPREITELCVGYKRVEPGIRVWEAQGFGRGLRVREMERMGAFAIRTREKITTRRSSQTAYCGNFKKIVLERFANR